jgi:hypothetical protein
LSQSFTSATGPSRMEIFPFSIKRASTGNKFLRSTTSCGVALVFVLVCSRIGPDFTSLPESAVQFADEIVFRGDAYFCMAAGTGRKVRSREVGHGKLSRHQKQNKTPSTSCVRLWRKHDYGDRAKPQDQIAMGCDGTGREASNAVYSGWHVHRGCRRRKSNDVRKVESELIRM